MKKLLPVLGMLVLLLFCLIGCGDPNESTKKDKISVPDADYTVVQGNVFTLPTATIEYADEENKPQYVINVSVTDKDGTAVNVQENRFVADVVGNYTAVYTDAENKLESVTITIVCTANPLKSQNAPRNLAVSKAGVLTFEADGVEGETYTLYVDGASKGAVESGDSIKEYLSETAVSVTVAVDAREGYAASAQSQAISVRCEKAIANLAFDKDGGTISFTYEGQGKVALYVSGERVAEVQSGADVTSYLKDGTNDLSVVVETADANTVDSQYSNSVIVVRHPQITDFAIENGVIRFSSRGGYVYNLFDGETDKGAVQSGASVSDIGLAAGAHTLSVKISVAEGGEENAVYYIAEEKSNTFSVTKFAKVTDVAVSDDIITFTEEANAEYHLYFDGTDVGTIESESSLKDLYETYGEVAVQVQAHAGSDAYLNGEMSDAYALTVPKYSRLMVKESAGLTVADGSVPAIGPDAAENGMVVRATGGSASLEFSKPVDLLGLENEMLLRFRPMNGVPDQPGEMTQMTMYITDVDDPTNQFFIRFFINVDTAATGQVYVNISYCDKFILWDINWDGNPDQTGLGNQGVVALFDFGGAHASATKFGFLKFDGATKQLSLPQVGPIDFSSEAVTGAGNTFHGFENGAIVSITYDFCNPDNGGGLLITHFAGNSYRDGQFFTPEEYEDAYMNSDYFTIDKNVAEMQDNYTSGSDKGTYVKGATKDSTADTYDAFTSKNAVPVSKTEESELIRLKFLNDAYTDATKPEKLLRINIIDADNEENVIQLLIWFGVALGGRAEIYYGSLAGNPWIYGVNAGNKDTVLAVSMDFADGILKIGDNTRDLKTEMAGFTGFTGFESGAKILVGFEANVSQQPEILITHLGGQALAE